MSTITRMSVFSHCNDLGGKVWNPSIKWTKKYAVFVVIENDAGVSGLGECWCFDSSPDTLVAYLRTEIAQHVIGLKVQDYPRLYEGLLSRATLTARHGLLASAMSGIDIALCDLQSRAADQPLWEFLSDHSEDDLESTGDVYLYGSGGLYGENKSTDDLVAEMIDMEGSGFNLLKMKVGGQSINEDADRVCSVIEALDSRTQLIIDGVYQYSVAEAKALFEAIPGDRIEAFQSPIAASDLPGMRGLREAGIPVMGNEAEYRDEVHRQLIEGGAVNYLQAAPIACGGISRLIELDEMQGALPHSTVMFSLEVSSTAVALLAASHFAAASSIVAHTEYHYLHQVFFDDLDIEPIGDNLGWFQLSDDPGLGFTLPTEQVKTEFEVSTSA